MKAEILMELQEGIYGKDFSVADAPDMLFSEVSLGAELTYI